MTKLEKLQVAMEKNLKAADEAQRPIDAMMKQRNARAQAAKIAKLTDGDVEAIYEAAVQKIAKS